MGRSGDSGPDSGLGAISRSGVPRTTRGPGSSCIGETNSVLVPSALWVPRRRRRRRKQSKPGLGQRRRGQQLGGLRYRVFSSDYQYTTCSFKRLGDLTPRHSPPWIRNLNYVPNLIQLYGYVVLSGISMQFGFPGIIAFERPYPLTRVRTGRKDHCKSQAVIRPML